MEVSGQLDAPAALPLGKEPRYRLSGRLIGPGRFGEEKNLPAPPVIKPRFLGRPARSLVTLPTELSRLCLSAGQVL
jgi:hypothetical protein